MLLLLLEREEGGEREKKGERETLIGRLLYTPQLGIEHTT